MSAAVGIPGSSVLLIPVVPRPMRSIQSTRHPTKYNPRYSTLSILAARNQTPFDTLFSDAAPAVWLHERTLFAAELRCESFPKEVTMESALAPSLRIGKTNLLRISRVLCLRAALRHATREKSRRNAQSDLPTSLVTAFLRWPRMMHGKLQLHCHVLDHTTGSR